MSHRKARGHHEEEHENHERWLVTYADMVTLLMVLFIVMFAMSQVDERKFNELRQGLAAGFGQSTSLMDGSDSILDEPGTAVAPQIKPDVFVDDLPPEQQVVVREALSRADQARLQQQYADADAEVSRLEELVEKMYAALGKHGLADDVRTSIDERGLVVSLVSRHVVFEPNLADLTERGRRVLDTLAPVLADIDDPLRVDGHTNQVKVKPKYYATDWDLSSARAITVLRHLNEVSGIPGARLTVAAYGHEKPLMDPARPGSQRINKRVDLVVLSTLPEETRALLRAVIAERRTAARAEKKEGDRS